MIPIKPSVFLGGGEAPGTLPDSAWEGSTQRRLPTATRSNQDGDLIRARVDEIEPGSPIAHGADSRRNRAIGQHPARGQHDRIEGAAEAPIPYELVAGELVAGGIGVRLVHPQ